jgi:PAS domain-containing protein
MSSFIFFYALSVFLSGAIALTLGSYVLTRSRHPLNILYFLITVALFIVGFGEALMRTARSAGAARGWINFSIIGWFLVYSFFLNFGLIFSKIKSRFNFLLYLPSLAMMALYAFTGYFVAGMEKKYFGYVFIPGSWNVSYIIFYLAYMLTGIGLIFYTWLTAREYFRRKQAQYFVLAALIPLIGGTFSNQISVMQGKETLPVAIQIVAVTIWMMGYAIIRYAPVSQVSKEIIAEAVAESLLDSILIVNEDGRINYVNPAACQLFRTRRGDLINSEIDRVLIKNDQAEYFFRDPGGRGGRVSVEIFPIIEEKGKIYLLRDLSAIMILKESIRIINAELSKLIEREERLIAAVMKISEQTSQVSAQEEWEKINQDPAVGAIVKPYYDLMEQFIWLYEKNKAARDNLQEKMNELEAINRYMAGREAVYQKLQDEYDRLKK